MDEWLGFKEIDEAWQVIKGTAFRCFKRVEPNLKEGVDYRVFDVVADAAEIAALKAEGKSYRSSMQVVLVSVATVEKMKIQLSALR